MKKLLSIVATTAILLNSVLAPVSVLAQEVTPTPEPTPEATATPEATPTPEETTTPTEIPTASPTETPVESSSPTPEATLVPEETTTPEPTIEATATPANNEVQNRSPQDQQISNPTTAPTTIATSTPTSTPEPKEDISVSVSVVTTNIFPETVQENSVVKLITDKLDYAPTEVAVITGSGFESGKTYSLTVSSSDDPATSTTSDITMDGSGSFTYNYQLDGNYRPNYSVTVKYGEVLVASTTFTDSASVTTTLSNIACIAENPKSPNNLNCTANDVSLASVSSIQINDDGCKFPGDTVNFTANWNVHANATSRYNVGVWFATSGQASAKTGPANSCSVTSLPSTPAPFFDGGTSCGGVNSGSDGTISITMTAVCNPDTSGLLKLPYCTSWQENNHDSCSIPTDAVPGTASKCNCQDGFTIPVPVPPSTIEVVKVLSPSNDPGLFNLKINGTTKASNVGNGGDTGIVSQVAGTNTIGESAGTGTLLTNYTSTVVCKDKSNNNIISTTGSNPWTLTTALGQNVLCTVTNTQKQATLTLVKTITNNNGGSASPVAWTLSATSTGTTISGTSGSVNVTNAAVNTGTYTLSETGGPTGYTAGPWSCVKNGGAPVTGSSITLAGGDNATCTINNDDIAPKLTLVKNVVNTDGGTASASAWTLSATGEGGFSGTGTQDPILNKATLGPTSVKANVAYTLSESGAFTNYTAGNWSCNGGVMGNAAPTITLQPGQDVICSITNTHYKSSPTISTTLSASSINVGGTVHDTATLTGATSNAGGMVTYNVYSDNSCSTFVAGPGVKTVTDSSVPNSDDVTFTKAGDYYWQASYSGDTNNNSALSACTEEHLVVNKVNPAISTLPNPTTALLGATIADTATLSGGFNPTGNIAFSLYDPDNTTCDPASRMWYEEVTVNGNGTYNTSNFSNTIKAGTWRWVASYSGDTNNNSISGGCSDELVTINKANTNVTTSVYNAEGQDITNSTDVLGANVHDSATVSGQVGVIGITGTITYNFYENNSCTGEPAGSETTTISGYPFTTSSSTKLNMGAGSYSYMATYSGDSNYNGSTGICEPFSIGKADSSVTTEVHNSDHQDVTNQTLNPGISVHDSATVLGTSQSFRPTGNVTYYFFTNGSCYGETADSETVEVGSETEARLISEPGSYSYQANYEGDNNFNSSIGECEPFAVGSPSVSIAKTNNSGSGVHAGSTITYTLTISNTGSMNLDNLKITDILPGGFSYILGSTTGATISDPTISGNILTWNIESLSAEQSITISYQASTATNLSDGTYTNFATCRAYFGDEGSVECDDANSEVSIGSTFGYSGNMAGQVLGASTMLPGTGSPTVLVIIGLGFLGTGIALNIASRKKYAKK